MLWAIHLPRTVLSGGARDVLNLLGDRADENGAGAYPSARTLAQDLAVTERTVKRHLAELEDLGLIRRGNQARASRLPRNRRPVVWDLAMPTPAGVTLLSPQAGSGVTGVTPQQGSGVTDSALRGDRFGLPGVTPGVIENRPSTRPEPPSAHARTHAPVHAREGTTGGGDDLPNNDSPAVQLVQRCLDSMDRETQRRVAPGYVGLCQPAAAALLMAGWSAGDVVHEVGRSGWPAYLQSPGKVLRSRLVDLVQVPSPTQAAEDAKASWPDKCDECDDTRHVETPSGAMRRCPRCHPSVSRGLGEAMGL
jgi:hypothetical protein